MQKSAEQKRWTLVSLFQPCNPAEEGCMLGACKCGAQKALVLLREVMAVQCKLFMEVQICRKGHSAASWQERG